MTLSRFVTDVNCKAEPLVIDSSHMHTIMHEQCPPPRLAQIVALSKNGTIGRDGKMPWKMPSDMKLFKELTMGKPCIMGRVTWESLRSPLKGRDNLVLSRDKNYRAEGAEVHHSLQDVIGRGYELAGQRGVEEVMVIGGAQLYEATLHLCNIVYMTEIDAEIAGDTHYPRLPSGWRGVKQRPMVKTTKDQYPFKLKIFKKPCVDVAVAHA